MKMAVLRVTALAAALAGAQLLSPASAQDAAQAAGDFDPELYCNHPRAQSLMPDAAVQWGREVNAEELIHGENFEIREPRVLAFDAGESVTCRVNLAFDFPSDGGTIAIVVENADFIIWGNEDGSETYVAAFDWPTAAELEIPDNRYNRNLVINGETFQQAWDRKRAAQAGQPQNILEAIASAQGAYNAELEAELRRRGMGPLLDAEARRRAALTPAQRAREDAWNRGPAPGETICIDDENGVRRCKSG